MFNLHFFVNYFTDQMIEKVNSDNDLSPLSEISVEETLPKIFPEKQQKSIENYFFVTFF